ncbi:MAG: PEP-CTERM sorting domain-containing protein [Planctomycetia bacterium]|nr:PEP-CTERM sorting domain-containing protein [Planctomycetia bacterium]
MRVTSRIVVLTAAALLTAAGTSRAGNILFLAGTLPLSAADQNIVNRMTTLGYTVTAMDDNVAVPADMVGKQLLVVSSTVGSGSVRNQWNSTGPVTTGGDGALLRNLAYPVLDFENGLSDEIGFVIATQGGQGVVVNAGSSYPAAGNDINIVAPAHPLAAGLAGGFQPVYTVNGSAETTFGSTSFGTFGNRITPDADIIAMMTATATFGLPTDASNVGIIALEQGDTLGNAAVDPDYAVISPCRRVGFLLEDTNFGNLNANGLSLFDAAVNYAAATACVPEPGTLVLAGLGLVGLVAYRRRVRG